MATEVAQLPHLNIVNRVLELPIVELALHKSVETYSKVKDSNQLVHWAFTTAETSLSTATRQAIPIAAPIAKKLESPINFVDYTLCLGLDKIEEKVPLVKEKPQQILMKAKSRISYVNDLIVAQASNLGSASWVKANQILDTQYGNAAVRGLDNTAFAVDKLIDKYFPATEKDQEKEGNPENTHNTQEITAEEDKLLHTLQTIGHLSNKASRRVYSNVIRHLGIIKKEVLLKDYVRRLVEFLHLTSYLQCNNTTKESKQVQVNGETNDKRHSEPDKEQDKEQDKRNTEPEENSNIEKEKNE